MSNIDKHSLANDESVKTYYIHPAAFGSTKNPGYGHVAVVRAEDFEKLRTKLEAAENLAKQQGNIAVALFDEVTNLRRNADDSATELRAQLEEAEKLIAELEAREVNGRFPLPKDSSQGWKIDPEFISKIQDAIGYDEECQCWEGSPSMEMVEAVLIAAAAIKMDERG